MSDVKKMDIWTVVRTVLEKNPGIKAKELIAKVRVKTDLSRSTIYEHLHSFELKGKIYREKGKYWRQKPKKHEPEITFEDELKMLELAAKLAAEAPPFISRDVYIQIGKHKVKVEHE